MYQYLVDTNIISELAKKKPNKGVLEWASGVQHFALSVITVEELFFGLSWKPNAHVQKWIENFLEKYVTVVPIDDIIARRAGNLRGQFQSKGISRTQADLLIAATASGHGLTLVTRNVRDFESCGIALLDPFK